MKKSTLFYGILVGLLTILIIGNISNTFAMFNNISLTKSYSLYAYLSLASIVLVIPLFVVSLLTYKKSKNTAIGLLVICAILFIALSGAERILYFNDYFSSVNNSIANNNPEDFSTTVLLLNKRNAIGSAISSFTSLFITLVISISLLASNKKDNLE